MTRRQRFPRCRYTRTWMIRRGKRLCARCRYEWRPGLPLRLTRHQWRALLRCHVRGLSAAAIAEETEVHRQRVLRALTLVRVGMEREVPAIFPRGAFASVSQRPRPAGALALARRPLRPPRPRA